MTSPFSNMYLALQSAIAPALASFAPEGGAVYVDIDKGQLERPDRPDVSPPCVLVQLPDWSFKDMSKGAQEGAGHIVLKVVDTPYSSTSNITPQEYIESALRVFEMEQAVFTAIHNHPISFTADNSAYTAKLSRITARSDGRRPGLAVRENTYSCSFQDYSAVAPAESIPVPPMALTANMVFPE